MKKKISFKIGLKGYLVGCLLVCLLSFNFPSLAESNLEVKGNNNIYITVQSGGNVTINNQSSNDNGNLGYSVAITNDSGVDATFANDVDVVGDLTAGTITSDAGISSTGALLVGTTLTVGTNLTGTDGVISYTDSIATGTTNSVIGKYTLTCSDKDEGGCDDGDVLTLISALMEVSDASGTTGEEATSALKMFVTLDDSATSSKEISFTISGSADDTTSGDQVWQEIDSGNVMFPNGNLSVGTTSIANTLTVDEDTATTTIQFGSAISDACIVFYAGTARTLYYLDPSAISVDDFATTTKPGWCS